MILGGLGRNSLNL